MKAHCSCLCHYFYGNKRIAWWIWVFVLPKTIIPSIFSYNLFQPNGEPLETGNVLVCCYEMLHDWKVNCCSTLLLVDSSIHLFLNKFVDVVGMFSRSTECDISFGFDFKISVKRRRCRDCENWVAFKINCIKILVDSDRRFVACHASLFLCVFF